MRRLKIAYLPASLSPGGAERQMLALAERLPRDRFEPEFVVLSGDGLYDARATQAALRIRTVGDVPAEHASRIGRARHRVAKSLNYVAAIRSGRYDIVDAWLYPADVLAALMRPLTHDPIVVGGQRNVDPESYFGPMERPIARLSGRLTTVVVANSEAARQHAITIGGMAPTKVRVIHNGVVIAPPRTDEGRRASRQRLDVADPDTVVIGCVANLSPVKRHDLILEAFAPLAADALPVRLVLIGEGSQRQALERQIRALGLDKHVRLVGLVPDPEPLYDGMDVVVQASEREGLPNSLLEAGAAGLPMVATLAGGSGEIVLDGRTGVAVNIGDAAGLTAGLRSLVTDRALRDRLGHGARTHVGKTFGMDRFVAEFAALYESLAAARDRERS